jgi:hypothetical protein
VTLLYPFRGGQQQLPRQGPLPFMRWAATKPARELALFRSALQALRARAECEPRHHVQPA